MRQTAIFFNGKYYEHKMRLHPVGESLDLRPDYGSINVSDYSDLGEIELTDFGGMKIQKLGQFYQIEDVEQDALSVV